MFKERESITNKMSDLPEMTDGTEITKLVDHNDMFNVYIMNFFFTPFGAARWEAFKGIFQGNIRGSVSARAIIEDWIRFMVYPIGFVPNHLHTR